MESSYYIWHFCFINKGSKDTDKNTLLAEAVVRTTADSPTELFVLARIVQECFVKCSCPKQQTSPTLPKPASAKASFGFKIIQSCCIIVNLRGGEQVRITPTLSFRRSRKIFSFPKSSNKSRKSYAISKSDSCYISMPLFWLEDRAVFVVTWMIQSKVNADKIHPWRSSLLVVKWDERSPWAQTLSRSLAYRYWKSEINLSTARHSMPTRVDGRRLSDQEKLRSWVYGRHLFSDTCRIELWSIKPRPSRKPAWFPPDNWRRKKHITSPGVPLTKHSSVIFATWYIVSLVNRCNHGFTPVLSDFALFPRTNEQIC